jgi:glycosyltransferase involved in cell wall biosynthesis
MCAAYPEAPIYTSVYDPTALPVFHNKDVRTSFLQHWPLARRRHQLYPVLRRRAFESFDLSDFDVVLSSDHAEAKGVLTLTESLHIAYIHTPTRYYWSDYSSYLRRPGFGSLDPVVRRLMPTMTSSMRQWDFLAAQRPDFLLANSRIVARRIEKYYRRHADVLHAPVDISRFHASPDRGEHLLVVSRLIPYKRVDLAVLACRELGLPLKVVGDGPEMGALRTLAGPRTTFLGEIDDEAVAQEYGSAAAFLFPAREDFGLTPLEAMASGTPVLAFRGGGALETVIEGKTGAFFDEQSVQSLTQALRLFNSSSYDPTVLIQHARNFGVESFVERLRSYVDYRWAGVHASAARFVRFD